MRLVPARADWISSVILCELVQMRKLAPLHICRRAQPWLSRAKLRICLFQPLLHARVCFGA